MESYLILDGYNILSALERYRGGAQTTLSDRRESLIRDSLKAAGWTGAIIILVFDAPRSSEPGTTEMHAGGALRVIYTAPGETADDQIERLVEKLTGDVRVYTADFAQQRTILARGGTRATPAEFADLLDELPALVQSPEKGWRSRVADHMSVEARAAFEEIRRKERGD